jgi:hypothetical protein
MSLLADHYLGGFWREHPYGNLQPLPTPVNDRHRAVFPFRSAKDLNGSALERMKRIEDLDLTIFWTQGIVGVGVFIPMSTASSRRVGSPAITHAGFALALDSFSRFTCFAAYFAASSSPGSSRHFTEGSCTFPAIWLYSLNLRCSPLGSGRCFAKIGSSIPNHPSVAPST